MSFGKETDLASGNVRMQLLRLCVPVTIGMLMQNLYAIVDLYWVGRLGPNAIAAVAISGVFFFVFFSIAQIIGVGALALVARSIGQGKPENGVLTIRNSSFASALVGVMLSIAGFVYAREIIVMLGGKGEVILLGEQFFKPFAIGFFFQMMLFPLTAAMRGTGDMRTPMNLMVITNALNFVLDPLLIYGWGPFPKWGVAGAGIATTLSTGIAAGYAYYALAAGKSNLTVRIGKHFRPDWSIIFLVIRIGAPSGVQFGFLSLSIMMLMKAVAGYGMESVAAFGACNRLLSIAFIPMMGIGAAVSAIVGQSLGAGKPHRVIAANRAGIVMAVVGSGIIAAAFALFPDFFMGFFTKSGKVLALSRDFLRISFIHEMFLAVAVIYNSTFSGAGDNISSMIAAVIRSLLLIALGFTLPGMWRLGINGVWLSFPISSFIGMFLVGYMFRLGRWKTHMNKYDDMIDSQGI
ncbi:MAG TPA: MATE family efflux transporter [bacterium]|nr:MATE family efflux transporter [bacterium]